MLGSYSSATTPKVDISLALLGDPLAYPLVRLLRRQEVSSFCGDRYYFPPRVSVQSAQDHLTTLDSGESQWFEVILSVPTDGV